MELKDQKFIEHKAYLLREWSLRATTQAGSGHPTSCLSAADIVAVLFFYAMAYDPQDSRKPDNDRFILSKGHAAPLLYAAWHEVGVLSGDDLLKLRTFDSPLEGHPTARFAYAEAATGSLGQGLAIGVGMALMARMNKRTYRTWVLMGDSELAEGSVWEAAELAAHYRLNNLIALVDVNRLGQTGQTLEGHNLAPMRAKFEAFGWKVLSADGHDVRQLAHACDEALQASGQPIVILAHTFKGYGIEDAQDKNGYHGKVFSPADLPGVLAQLQRKFTEAAAYADDPAWHPRSPESAQGARTLACVSHDVALPEPMYSKRAFIAPRKAFGQALAALGAICDRAVVLDAEVKNSTYTELFEQAHPERFIQCFIAEQAMVGAAVGCATRGAVAFAATFGAFFSRAFDFVRMAAIGGVPLRLCGSHAGVSIGQDGPSQMGLEDMALMRTVPNSVVLNPCDAVSTYKLVEQMARYNAGISYLRTVRADMPVLYDNDETFLIGGSKVLHEPLHAQVCIVATGAAVSEALEAYELLAEQGIAVSVVDAYSIKPLDVPTLLRLRGGLHRQIVTVEDHYAAGGLGEAVCHALGAFDIRVSCLAVDQLPRSGTPAELRRYAGIDARAISAAVRRVLEEAKAG